jgi:hypothetical protein
LTARAGKLSKKAPERVPGIRQDPRYIFPENNARLFAVSSPNIVNCVCDAAERERQVASCILQPFPFASHAESLARRSADENIRRLDLTSLDHAGALEHVPVIRNLGEPVRQHGGRKRLDLERPSARETGLDKSKMPTADAVANRTERRHYRFPPKNALTRAQRPGFSAVCSMAAK